jgi:hypothetical protein
MKQKLVNYFKLGILFLGISLLVFGCQSDDQIIVKDENSHLQKGRIENFSKLSSFVEKLNKKPKDEVDGKTTSLEATNGFDIIYDQDLYIQEKDGVETFSIPIHKHNQKGKTFSNLIVSFSDTETTEAFILTYHPNDEYLLAIETNEQAPFLGSVSTESINYDGSLDYLKSTGIDCRTVTIKYCNWGEENGDVHLGGDNCTEGYYWFETVTVCTDDEPTLLDIPASTGGNPVENSSNSGDYSTSGTNSGDSTTQDPMVVPNPPRTLTRLDIDGMSLEMTEWLNQLENFDFKEGMMKFLEEEGHLPDTELEAYLLIKSESSTTPWADYSGNFNNIPSLAYTQIRHEVDYTFGYNYTEFKLTNGDTILFGDFAQTIDEDGNYFTAEPDVRRYYKSKEHKRLYKIPQPYNNYPSVDLNQLWSQFWGGVQIGIRYCTPLEEFVILIDGKDFDGVEQSRAVAGLSILVDNIPFGKAFKIVKKAGVAIDASIPIVRRFTSNIYKIQRRLVKSNIGIIEAADKWVKGRWGEMATDVDMINKGYEPKHINRVTSIETGGHTGVDHVFKNPQTGQYVIVESKFKSTGNMAYTNTPGTNSLLPRQMSDEWLTYNDNLINAVGEDVANEILSSDYVKLISVINPDGNITYRKVDELGNVISGNAGIYNDL